LEDRSDYGKRILKKYGVRVWIQVAKDSGYFLTFSRRIHLYGVSYEIMNETFIHLSSIITQAYSSKFVLHFEHALRLYIEIDFRPIK
jgi:hypothetical protein